MLLLGLSISFSHYSDDISIHDISFAMSFLFIGDIEKKNRKNKIECFRTLLICIQVVESTLFYKSFML